MATGRRAGIGGLGTGVAAVGMAAVLALPLLAGGAVTDAATNAMSFAMLAVGLNVVVGYCGLLDLGYAAFFAIGAYTYGVLAGFQLMPHWSAAWAVPAALGLVRRVADPEGDMVRFTLSFWLGMPLAGLVAAGCGVAFGVPTLRLRGDYLAIVTLGFGEIVPIVARNWSGLTGGAQGLDGIAGPALFGWRFGLHAAPYYYAGLLVLGAMVAGSRNLARSRWGRAMMAVRDDALAAACAGVNVVGAKLAAFALGAGCAGVAGVVYVAKLHIAGPEMFGFPVSVMVLAMVVLGGVGNVWGAVAGGLVVSLLQSVVLPALGLGRASELVFGVLLVAMMLFRREGLLPARPRGVAGVRDAGVPDANVPDGGVWRMPRRAVAVGEALDVQALSVRFGGLQALDRVALRVAAGGALAVIGPNGSGKSTLFNAVSGLVAAQGSMVLFGRELRGLAAWRRARAGVARSFQNIRLFGGLSVLDNVLVGAHGRLRTGLAGALLGLPAGRREEAAARDEAVAILSLLSPGLAKAAGRPVASLSYADRRRVEIARALAAHPRLLLLDEPAAGMNEVETRALAGTIDVLRGMGIAILLIEHKLDLVALLAGEVLVLDHGTMLARGTAAQMRDDPAVLEAWLGPQPA